MTALDTIHNILSNDYLLNANLKWCYVDKDKVPYNGPCLARPNVPSDFIRLEEFDISLAERFAGVGVSIQASRICAIDVDHCFSVPFDISSADARAQDIINIFGDATYIEFSFSGTGLRILFRATPIQDYAKKYYIKNSKNQIEYYYPEGSNRYVTVTAKTIIYSGLNFIPDELLRQFLDTYMLRPRTLDTDANLPPIEGDVEQLLLHFLRSNKNFQDNWFEKAPGSGSNESERDFFLLKFIFENITNNKDQMKEVFERSPFFKSKDRKHKYKWEKSDNRYFNYLYNVISGGR